MTTTIPPHAIHRLRQGIEAQLRLRALPAAGRAPYHYNREMRAAWSRRWRRWTGRAFEEEI